MARESEPYKRLIIKLCFPRSDDATRKVDYSAKPIIKSYWVARDMKKSDHEIENLRDLETTVQGNSRSKVDAVKVARTVFDVLNDDVVGLCDQIKKMTKVASTIRTPEKSSHTQNSRKRVLGSKDCSNNVGFVDSHRKKKMKVDTVVPTTTTTPLEGPRGGTRNLKNYGLGIKKKKKRQIIDIKHCKKMQCWAMLKRMMVGRDGWALKQLNLDLESEGSLSKSTTKITFKDIEAKVNKWLYSKPDEFANDIRLVFSRALLLYPPRTEIHRIAIKLSDNFETAWNSVWDKWKLEARFKVNYQRKQ